MRRVVFLFILAAVPALLYAVEAAEPKQQPPRPLFDGLDNLHFVLKDTDADPSATWSSKNGVIHCTGVPTGYFRTTEPHEVYTLTFDWRWPGKGGNNGVLLHIQDKDEVWPKSIEVQLQHENAGDFWVIGGADFREHINPESRRVPKQEKSSERALGEWNTCKIECRGDIIKVSVNGVLQNVATECTVQRGYIGFQSEGTPIEYRNVQIQK